ncbi:hypothetical protein LTR47_003117 [Exophiala xenobiotica]|nr:hypothetical protein LTR47_003117 [Exophiala xenobiotica]KAK5248536.1 hypothetical protein LTS06_006484 [Exophiala xenobiotica]KAK5280845.1 hypothetical protein LTR40_005766 [Exophiala xenobiotica]KAK5327479.1 hypothetical protein LTR93_002863 [Exophiala xenobiotica]KAK5353875.1 hypothetical protein LTR61_002569 [Exophiala xenobiotica]
MEDSETQTRNERSPLLPSDRRYLDTLRSSRDFVACHIIKIHGEESSVWKLRTNLQRFLSSKWGHYFVIALVALDISCIFADFLISLHMCEHRSDEKFPYKDWQLADHVLDYVSLAFSCLFMAELLGSVFAFGLGYFRSKFHIFDACVIVAAFIIDVLLRGPVEEAGSLVVIGRLWRVFKIIEEFSTGAEDELEDMYERLEQLEQEKDKLVKENQELRFRGNGNISDGDGTAH